MHTVEDFLHHQQFRRQQHRNIFEPSFYSGGVFDSRRGPFADDFPLYQALTSLQSQLDGEQTKYFIKHGTKEGFKPRFAFGDDMGSLFEKASAIVFSEGARPTVGLNPERFIEKCPSCKEWLLGYEFNTEYCEPCGSRKQAAIERYYMKPAYTYYCMKPAFTYYSRFGKRADLWGNEFLHSRKSCSCRANVANETKASDSKPYT
jgi:hypothetical protein